MTLSTKYAVLKNKHVIQLPPNGTIERGQVLIEVNLGDTPGSLVLTALPVADFAEIEKVCSDFDEAIDYLTQMITIEKKQEEKQEKKEAAVTTKTEEPITTTTTCTVCKQTFLAEKGITICDKCSNELKKATEGKETLMYNIYTLTKNALNAKGYTIFHLSIIDALEFLLDDNKHGTWTVQEFSYISNCLTHSKTYSKQQTLSVLAYAIYRFYSKESAKETLDDMAFLVAFYYYYVCDCDTDKFIRTATYKEVLAMRELNTNNKEEKKEEFEIVPYGKKEDEVKTLGLEYLQFHNIIAEGTYAADLDKKFTIPNKLLPICAEIFGSGDRLVVRTEGTEKETTNFMYTDYMKTVFRINSVGSSSYVIAGLLDTVMWLKRFSSKTKRCAVFTEKQIEALKVFIEDTNHKLNIIKVPAKYSNQDIYLYYEELKPEKQETIQSQEPPVS